MLKYFSKSIIIKLYIKQIDYIRKKNLIEKIKKVDL